MCDGDCGVGRFEGGGTGNWISYLWKDSLYPDNLKKGRNIQTAKNELMFLGATVYLYVFVDIFLIEID